MAEKNVLSSLFTSGGIDEQIAFVDGKEKGNRDGILRIDLAKAKDKKKGYMITLRLLPNITQDNKFGPISITKMTHFINIKEQTGLSGHYDSPRNFETKENRRECKLSKLYSVLKDSTNIVQKENMKYLQYSVKNYSYALVVENEQEPEMVGKIVIFQYGPQIMKKIKNEKDGENNSRTICNVFDLVSGKDLRLIAIETTNENGVKMPDYTSSFFYDSAPLSIYDKENKKFIKCPVKEGVMSEKVQAKVIEFLKDREYELELHAPKELTDVENAKIDKIVAYLSGKPLHKDDLAANDFDVHEETSAPAKTNPAAASKPAAPVTTADDDENDFFN